MCWQQDSKYWLPFIVGLSDLGAAVSDDMHAMWCQYANCQQLSVSMCTALGDHCQQFRTFVQVVSIHLPLVPVLPQYTFVHVLQGSTTCSTSGRCCWDLKLGQTLTCSDSLVKQHVGGHISMFTDRFHVLHSPIAPVCWLVFQAILDLLTPPNHWAK